MYVIATSPLLSRGTVFQVVEIKEHVKSLKLFQDLHLKIKYQKKYKF